MVSINHLACPSEIKQLMNGRWFGGRQIEAQFHDGDPKYDPKKEETTQENEEQRLKQYAEWLESQQ